MWRCTWMFVHEEVRRQPWVWFLKHHFHFSYFWKRSLTELGGACQGGWPGFTSAHSACKIPSASTMPGFSTWLLGIKLRSATKPFPQLLSICLFFFPENFQSICLLKTYLMIEKKLQLTFLRRAHKDSSSFNTVF